MLRFPLAFYWLSGVKWIRMWSHRPWLRLLTESQLQFYPGLWCSSHNFVNLSCVNIHSFGGMKRLPLLYEGPRQTRDWAVRPSFFTERAHSRKRPALVTTIFSNFRGGRLRELRLQLLYTEWGIWHVLFEVLAGWAFDHLSYQHTGEFDQNFSKKSNARGFSRGGGGSMDGFGSNNIHFIYI